MSEKALTGRLREEGLSTDRPQAVPSVLPVDSARRGNARYLPSMRERMWGGAGGVVETPSFVKEKGRHPSDPEMSAFLLFPSAVRPPVCHRRKKSSAVLTIILRSIQNEQLST